MDVVLYNVNINIDHYVLGHPWLLEGIKPNYSLTRQFFVIWFFYLFSGYVMYFLFAGVSYWHKHVLHKRIYFPHWSPKREDVMKEIKHSCSSLVWLAFLQSPFTLLEELGYSKKYTNLAEYGYGYAIFSVIWFIVFADICIYWIHRIEHTNSFLYKHIHKPHHSHIYVTPFASHAFNPIDGWAQSWPYVFFAFIFPFHNWLNLIVLVIVNFWTINIHDQISLVQAKGLINGAGHHDMHHRKFLFNYGEYFTIMDRLFGTYADPDPLHATWPGAPNWPNAESSKNMKERINKQGAKEE